MNVFGKRKIFVPFVVVGDPDYDTSKKIIMKMIDEGADMLELGFAFSDPIADGPTIQLADKRALDNDACVDSSFRMIQEIRKYSRIPISLLIYSNLVHRRGIDNFYADAHNAGVDYVLVADVPIEEAGPFLDAARNHGVDTVFIISQTTTYERISLILKNVSGYIYLVSILGVTGARKGVSHDTLDLVRKVTEKTDVPVLVGFGVSEPAHAQKIVTAGADGVIVGSAIVRIIEKNLDDKKKIVDEIGKFVREMKEAVKRATQKY